MYRLVPITPLPLKTYWCADLQVAEEVAEEIKTRFGCQCEIVDVPAKQSWTPDDLLEAALFRRVRAFELSGDLRFGCSKEQLEDALCHAKGNILKIKDSQEIFCFKADDPFWQRQYLYDQTC